MTEKTYVTNNTHNDIQLDTEMQQQMVDQFGDYLDGVLADSRRNSAIGWGILGAGGAAILGYVFKDNIVSAAHKATDKVREAFGKETKWDPDDPLLKKA